MPQSPFQRAAEINSQEDSSSASGKRKGGKSRPTTSRRNARQKTKEKYAKAREDAQLQGLIPTTPEGAIRDERAHSVDPLEGLPATVRQALRENWATPAEAKPAIIAALLRPFFNEVTMIDKDGNQVTVPPSPKTLNELAKTILSLDQTQYERDHPMEAGKAKGPAINGVPTTGNVAFNISVQSNRLAVNVLRDYFENEVGGGVTDIGPLIEHKEGEPPRFDGEVETGAAATDGYNES